jgi:hypothetical protein
MSFDVTLDDLMGYCREAGYKAQPLAGDDALLVAIWSTLGMHQAMLWLLEDRHTIALVVPGLAMVPRPRRETVAAALMHINRDTVTGGFTMDLRDGEVSYRSSLPYMGVGVCAEQLDTLLGRARWTLSTHLGTVQRLCFNGESAEQAVGIEEATALQAFRAALEEESDGPDVGRRSA